MAVCSPAVTERTATGVIAEGDLEASLRACRPVFPTGAERRLGIESVLLAVGVTCDGGPRLGRYRVEERLGEGAMGVVYRAHDPVLDRAVAVKVLRSMSGAGERARVRDEGRALARLASPHVVALHDLEADGQDVFLTMEHVPGESLSHWLATHPDAPWRERVGLFIQAARGLADAHRAGVVHGDFKPDNVLVGRDGRVRVADFGIARLDDQSTDFVGGGGTPRYLAPEVRCGQHASFASDQYSFCLSLAEALEARGVGELGAAARAEEAIRRGLSPDAGNRWPSMDDLVRELSEVLGSLPADPMREVLLERVEQLWLLGVLRASLSNTDPVALALEPAPEGLVGRGMAAFVEGGCSTADVATLLTRGGGSLLLLGAPGSGKTTALLCLAVHLLRSARADPDAPAPVVLNLSSFRPEERPLASWVIRELVTKYSLPRPAAERWLEGRRLALLLDGFDEVAPGWRPGCIAAINEFRRTRALPIVVTSREEEYRAAGERLGFGVAARLLPPDDAAVGAILERRGKGGIVEVFGADPGRLDNVRNPLVLSLLAESGSTARAGGDGLDVYGRYVRHALAQAPKSERARIEDGLGWLAAAMGRKQASDLWLEQLDSSWLGPGWERWAAVALGIATIATLQVALVAGVLSAVGRPRAVVVIATMAAVVTTAILTRGYRVRPMEAVTWSWRRAARRMPLNMTLGAAAGALVGLPGNFAAYLALGVLGAVTLTLMAALEPSDRETRVRPNEGVLRSVRYGIVFSLLFAPTTAALFGYGLWPYLASQPDNGLSSWADARLRLTLGVTSYGVAVFFMLQGGAAAILHGALRVMLALRTPLPLDLARFLDACAERGLLRRVGGGYIFLHRTLLEYFATRRERAAEMTRR